MQTRTWLCGAVFGCGLVMAVPPVAPMSGPVTSEEMIEPSVRSEVEHSRALIVDDLLRQKRELEETIHLFSRDHQPEGDETEARKAALEAAKARLERMRRERFRTNDGRIIDEKEHAELLERQANEVMDTFHTAASKADFDAYFALMHEDGTFLGTDATERWTKAQFMDYARRFMVEQGKGWTYHPRDRHVSFSGDVAWFDELIDNEKYGTLRGQGVLRRVDGAWKIAQYSYSFTVPNDRAAGVVALILAQDGDGTP